MVFLKEMDYRMMNSMNSDPFYSSPFSVFPGRRHAPYMGQPDFRIYELNKRLQQRTEVTTLLNEPRREKTGFLHIRKTKTQISFAVTAKLISAFVFAK